MMSGGRVADLWLNACLTPSLLLFEWSSDFERFADGLKKLLVSSCDPCSCSVLIMAHLIGDLRCFVCGRGGLIEIFEGGGDESNSENFLNIFNAH
jgi:hypothetical protein